MESNIEDLRQQLKENKQINFYPWVGDNYQEGLLGKKVLVLGESHYCPEELREDGACFPFCEKHKMSKRCFSQTEDIIDEFVYRYNGVSYQQTYLCFERGVCGKELNQNEREFFWHHIAFYNYIQYSQGGPRLPLEEVEDSSEAFRNVLDILQPDCIIIWGIGKLWKRLPDWGGAETEETIDNGDSTPVWNYNINGKHIPAMAVHHPSSSTGKSWPYWHEFYKKFIGEIDFNYMTK